MFLRRGPTYLKISIHAPREGGDNHHINDSAELKKFQSTPPARGATIAPPISRMPIVFQSTPPARGATPAIVVQISPT